MFAMESFKFYLPSNACENIYPNNTPNDYKTRLDNPIQLQGDWEVGVESVFYSSNIDNATEQAQIHCKVNALKERYLNNDAKKTEKLVLNPAVERNQRVEIVPDVFEKDPNNLNAVIKTLNDMNEYLVENTAYPAFRITKDTFSVDGSLSNLHISITPRLLKVLGYKPHTIMTSKEMKSKLSSREVSGRLTQEDYRIKIFNEKAKSIRIQLKALRTRFTGDQTAFLKLWKRTVQSVNPNIVASFKSGKFVIDNYDDHIAISFSTGLVRAVGHRSPIFGRSTTWSEKKAVLNRKSNSMSAWYIDIFDIHSEQLTKEVKYEFVVNVFPWQYDSIEKAMKYINEEVQKALKEKLKKKYRESFYKFQLTSTSGYSKLTLGPRLRVDLSRNLHRLFGVTKGDLLNVTDLQPIRRVSQQIKHEEELFLLSNIVKTTAYGQQHMHMLQSFLHQPKNSLIVTKRFEPIVYLPLLSNYIDMIHLQLTDKDYKPMNINDCTTIVCLYFRKVNEKIM